MCSRARDWERGKVEKKNTLFPTEGGKLGKGLRVRLCEWGVRKQLVPSEGFIFSVKWELTASPLQYWGFGEVGRWRMVDGTWNPYMETENADGNCAGFLDSDVYEH